MNKTKQRSDILLRRLGVEDAKFLQDFMSRIYPAAYAYLWKDQGAWYIKNIYDPKALAIELADEDNHFWLALDHENQALGWMKLIFNEDALGEPVGSCLYLQRIYLAPEAQGKGLGTYLCELAYDQARQLGKSTVWLESMDTGPALGFYQKLGFSCHESIQLSYPGMHDRFRTLITMKKKL